MNRIRFVQASVMDIRAPRALALAAVVIFGLLACVPWAWGEDSGSSKSGGKPAEAGKPEGEKPAEAPPGAGPPGGAPQGPPPALVRVGAVEQRKIEDRFPIVGRLRETRRSTVAAEESGRVTALNIEEGTVVTAGKSVLVTIDDTFLKLAVQSAENRLNESVASIGEAQARVERAQREFKTLSDMKAAASAHPKEVDDAKSEMDAWRAKLDALKAASETARVEVMRAKEALTRATVVAPYDGVVVKKLTEKGQWLAAGSPVAEVISRGEIDAVIDVPERYVNRIKPGESVEIAIDTLSMETQGKIESITPMGAGAARTFPVKVRMDDRGGSLKPGMSVTARIPISQQADRLLVPRDAVQFTDMGARVWMNANGVGLPRNVRVLFGLPKQYAVTFEGEGPPVSAGTQVVIEGAERLFPGRPLMIAPEKPVAAAQSASTTRPQ